MIDCGHAIKNTKKESGIYFLEVEKNTKQSGFKKPNKSSGANDRFQII